MERLMQLYIEYFKLTTELWQIQEDRHYWPEGWTYEDMVKQSNALSPKIRKLRASILFMEGEVKKIIIIK